MTPFKHQQEDFERFKDKAFGALFLEMGLGKSKIAIDLADAKFLEHKINMVLVITTKGLIGNWAFTEIPKHSSTRSIVVPWSDKITNMNLPNFKAIPNTLFWLITNVDATLFSRFIKYFKGIIAQKPEIMLIVDESTTVKSVKAKRTIRVGQIAEYCKYRFILSGAPITNSPLDVYSQCEIIQPGVLGFQNFWAFKSHYAMHKKIDLGMRSFQKIVGYRNLSELTDKLQKFASIRKKKDCLDLPPKMYRTIDCPLTVNQLSHYNNIKTMALTQIGDRTITVVNFIGVINKLLQICAGQIKINDKTYEYLETNRIELLKELIEEPEKTIVWCAFTGAASMIEEELGSQCVRITAEMTTNARAEALQRFRTDPAIKVLLANPASMGHGVTLTEASNVIYYARSFNLEHRLQSEDRTHRIGQTESVLYTDLLAEGTLERKVLKNLMEKKAMADSIITPENMRELLDG